MAQSSAPALPAFEELLPAIEKSIVLVCRRQRCSGEQADEFASYVRLKLLQVGGDLLRGFEGRCQLETFLFVVVYRLFIDFRREAWGVWRPSAQARRVGPAAVDLERLVHRDGLSVDEAVEMAATGRQDGLSRDGLRGIWEALPERAPRRVMVGDDMIPSLSAPAEHVEDRVLGEERRQRAQEVCAALKDVLGTLGGDEAAMLRLRFEGGLTVARIATLLRLPAKPLYRQIERLLARLRTGLEARGIEASEIAGLIGSDGFLEAGVVTPATVGADARRGENP